MNINPKTGIAYGIISASSLDGDVVDALMYGRQAINQSYLYVLSELRADRDYDHLSDDEISDLAAEHCIDEPTITGCLDNVTYETSWLGGTLHFFILDSPHITHTAGKGSMCVPGAGVIDGEGSETCYTVPADWLYSEDK